MYVAVIVTSNVNRPIRSKELSWVNPIASATIPNPNMHP